MLFGDARSRAAYEEFGDVVCFDSTYLTNKFNLPCAIFVGVNHHGQSILFGCALISWETAETYEWVLRTWLHCMGCKAPISILIDQDTTIRRDVYSTMSQTCHRWCIWHILQKFGRYVGKHEVYDVVKDKLENILYGSLDEDKFDARWLEAIEHYKLQDNAWLEACFCYYFVLLMSVRRKGHVDPRIFEALVLGRDENHTTVGELQSFLQRIRAESEQITDSNTLHYVRHLCTDFPAKEMFQKCYTDAKFKEVQRECTKCLYVHCLDQLEIGDNLMNLFLRIACGLSQNFQRKNQCQKLGDAIGGVSIFPEKYVLRRWRKDVQRKHTRVKVAYHDPLKTNEVRQYQKLMVDYEPICSKASTCAESVEAVVDLLQLMDLRVYEVLAMVEKRRQHQDKDKDNDEEDEGVDGVVRTPSSEGMTTPAIPVQGIPNIITPISTYQGSCDGSVLARIKDPPLPKKKAHIGLPV
ncbi:protein FAR-RED IMPAIRED RESPONSE 1-like [Chenopodium quinoa]|uniref:protein FAR-RED IMPAIRED RESPONSE 1-like n=1 Tax=Chenopodium quinoa TaxID=63459 RepID=UPI000B77AD1E|nr:protein FAR-RED IMPAIRED RESPONSE 1-like [Chenopodium quinoa]